MTVLLFAICLFCQVLMGGEVKDPIQVEEMGMRHEELGQWDQALGAYLEALQLNPNRSELLYKISSHYLDQGQFFLAYLFANEGRKIPSDANYLFDLNLSIAAFYTPYPEDGFEAAHRLVLNKQAPSHIRRQAYKNLLFYVKNLKNVHYQPVKIDLPLVCKGFSAHYNPMNPSILKTEEGYELICRTVNYITIGARHFRSLDILDPTNRIKTKNFLIKYDRDFQLLSQQEIIESLPRYRTFLHNSEGLEDCRIFSLNDFIYFTCTTLDTNPTGQQQISLCKLSQEQSGSRVYVEKLIPLPGPDPDRCEKNWLPFIKDGALHIIYSYDPLIVYKPDMETDPCIMHEVMQHDDPHHDFSRFSGSAAPVPFKKGWLLLVHEVTADDNSHRVYFHRFVYLDKNLKITKVSKPFTFLHQGVEYCCGMTLDHSGTKLILSIGVEDREAFLCTVLLKSVESMLEPLP